MSGSMEDDIKENQTKIDFTKEFLLENIIPDLPKDCILGIRVFYQQDKKSVINTIFSPNKYDIKKIKNVISQIGTPHGGTPIAYAINYILKETKYKKATSKRIFLITDGQENCGGDWKTAAKNAKNAGISSRIHILGVGIEEENVKQELEEFSEITGGTFIDINPQVSVAEFEIIQQKIKMVIDETEKDTIIDELVQKVLKCKVTEDIISLLNKIEKISYRYENYYKNNNSPVYAIVLSKNDKINEQMLKNVISDIDTKFIERVILITEYFTPPIKEIIEKIEMKITTSNVKDSYSQIIGMPPRTLSFRKKNNPATIYIANSQVNIGEIHNPTQNISNDIEKIQHLINELIRVLLISQKESSAEKDVIKNSLEKLSTEIVKSKPDGEIVNNNYSAIKSLWKNVVSGVQGNTAYDLLKALGIILSKYF